jgi:RNA polymerase sigma-70 factor (ECF subfamily)
LDETPNATQLIRRCLDGEGAAWEEIVRLHNRRIYNICYRFTGKPEDAEDLTQEVFIKVYRTLSTYDLQKGTFTTWVTTVTRNLLVDHFRKSKLERLSDSMDAPAGGDEDAPALGEQIADHRAGPEEGVATKETQKMVQDALQKLSPDLREALILRDLQDMDYKDIAQALRVPEGTVKSRINRGRTELARILSRTYRQVDRV